MSDYMSYFVCVCVCVWVRLTASVMDGRDKMCMPIFMVCRCLIVDSSFIVVGTNMEA